MKSIKQWPVLGSILRWSEKVSLPGFKGLSIYETISFIVKEASKDAIYTRANSVAFSFFMAIFPALIFLFTLIPFLPGTQDFVLVIKDSTQNIMPIDAHNYLFEMVDGVVKKERGGLRYLGAILALIFASSGMFTLMIGFDKNYEAFKKRSWLKQRLIALYLTILMSALLLFSFVLIVFGRQLINLGINFFHFENFATPTYFVSRFIGTFIVFYLGITMIYRLGPSLINRVPFWNPGAIVATLFSILSSLGFAYFINNFGRYNEIYGSIGALIVIMLWLQINAYIIIIGFELNVSIEVAGNNKNLLKNAVTYSSDS